LCSHPIEVYLPLFPWEKTQFPAYSTTKLIVFGAPNAYILHNSSPLPEQIENCSLFDCNDPAVWVGFLSQLATIPFGNACGNTSYCTFGGFLAAAESFQACAHSRYFANDGFQYCGIDGIGFCILSVVRLSQNWKYEVLPVQCDG